MASGTALKAARLPLGQAVANATRRLFMGPGVAHSMLFGMAAGVSFWATLFAGRVVYLTCFDTETVPLLSRARYEEKQRLFQDKLSQHLAGSVIASLMKEFNPVDLRLPFEE